MPAKKIIVALLIIAVAIGGFVAGLFLLKEQQSLVQEVAVPTGTAEVSISPETGTFNVGDTIETSVYFNPANNTISGVAVRITYPFSGSSPEVTVSSIKVNESFLSSGDWVCPTQSHKEEGTNEVIDIGCGNISAAGFTANTNTLLANITLKVERAPAVSPLVLRFDPAKSIITRKSDNQDVLLIPTSSGSYTIAGAQAQVTNTPTPTTSVRVTPTATKTPTPTKTATVSATPTGTGKLPDAGVSYPTIFGVGLGILVIAGALLLAL